MSSLLLRILEPASVQLGEVGLVGQEPWFVEEPIDDIYIKQLVILVL